MSWRSAATAAAVILISAVHAAGCSCEPEGWLATVGAQSGEVTVDTVDGVIQPHPAETGEFLSLGHRLRTGPSSRVVLQLRGGGELEVKPESEVLFGKGEAKKQVKLTLARGSVQSSGTEQVAAANELVIAVGERKVRLARNTKATVSAPASPGAAPSLEVQFGQATVDRPGGESETVVAGNPLTLTIAPAAPEEGKDEPLPAEERAPELVLYLEAGRKGRVLVQGTGEARARRVRPGEVVKVSPGSRITLIRGAVARVGPENGRGTEIRGPAKFMAREVKRPGGGGSTLRLESEEGGLNLKRSGAPGETSAGFTADGVHILPRITHRRVEIKVVRDTDAGGSIVEVLSGQAVLTSRGERLVLEVGQEGSLFEGGIDGPREPAPSGLTVQEGAVVRVFQPDRGATGLTLAWDPAKSGKGALVEVSRSPSMKRPLFADVISRNRLTLARPGRGTLYWRVRRLDDSGSPGEGKLGRATLVRDTSNRALKGTRAPHNVIQENYGDTTVYFQNKLPRFTFRWDAMAGADRYQVKILSEQNLTRPQALLSTAATRADLAAGKLGEGRFIWYVVGRDRAGAMVGSSSRISWTTS